MVIFFTLWLKKIVDPNTKSFKFETNANVGEIKIESIIMMIRNLNNWYPVNTVFDRSLSDGILKILKIWNQN